MERKNSFSHSMKDQSINHTCNIIVNNKQHKDTCNSNSQSSYSDDLLSGFSWPPRSYTCSFCKREFRSAQALGGHMNVHRRDRARLRVQSPPTEIGQYPSFLNLNQNPNPNNFSSFSPSDFTTTLPSLAASPDLSSLSSPSTASPSDTKKYGSPKGLDITKMKSAKSIFEVEEFEGFAQEDGYKFLKKTDNIVRLDLEIGLLGESKEELDLELRLGYS